MTTEDEAIDALRVSGMLDVLRWAAPAAFAATNQIYDEDAGHDQGVIGYLNFKHFKDLMDRATSNERFAMDGDVDGVGLDVLERGITPEVFRSMPPLASDAIVRSNYRTSPGWATNNYRVLLQSYTFGGIDEIRWAERSDAKRRVAAQQFPVDDTLFTDEELGIEFITGIPDDDDFSGMTLIAAHAFSPTTQQFELYIGQSKNPVHEKDECWHWRRLLLSGGTPMSGEGTVTTDALPGRAASTDVEDVIVRIKNPLEANGSGKPHG